jgi:signal transduction histidine kinase/HAMP domain-containing protein
MRSTDVPASYEHRSQEASQPRKRRHSVRRDARDEHVDEWLRSLRDALRAARQGDFSMRMPSNGADEGVLAEIALAFNSLVEQNEAFVGELDRLSRVVGGEGRITERASLGPAAGQWAAATGSLNSLVESLAFPTLEVARILEQVSAGDLSREMPVHVNGQPLQGDFLRLGTTVNSVVGRLRSVTAGVSRVVREIGTEGKLGIRASVEGLSGTWRDLVEDVNLLSGNLTAQVRNIALVSTAIANDDLSQKFVVEAKGEIASLADTINDMTETLRTFADQVTTVAREVGIEGKLGGQARVPGVAGTWRDLTDNVNVLAGNLTNRVRNIALVATAIANGDLSQKITVEAKGEILELKDTINQMIANLRDTTRTNKKQDWLKTNLAKFSGTIQGQRTLESLGQLIMSELTPVVSAQLGTFFVMDTEGDRAALRLLSSYGYTRRKTVSNRFALGEGLVGQAALEKKIFVVSGVPEDYVPILSSLGEAPPRSIVVLPILFEGQVRGVIELGSFEPFSPFHITFLEQLALSIGVVFNMISASRRTEELLEELKRSNAELGRRSTELEEKATLLEVRNREIADASASLEEKAKQLALVSKYKSEFLANMSHELRTPLNSIIILSSLLAENEEKNLTPEQLEYASTVLSSGRDLLGLINQILDLSKIEAGKMEIESKRVPLGEITAYAEQHFGPIALQKNLRFAVSIAPDASPTITTDAQRLQQILKKLLSNAFKFTESGSVEMRIALEADVRRLQSNALRRAPATLAFAITDTGIGVPAEKQQIIFETFQQADASTSRVYGGTGAPADDQPRAGAAARRRDPPAERP